VYELQCGDVFGVIGGFVVYVVRERYGEQQQRGVCVYQLLAGVLRSDVGVVVMYGGIAGILRGLCWFVESDEVCARCLCEHDWYECLFVVSTGMDSEQFGFECVQCMRAGDHCVDERDVGVRFVSRRYGYCAVQCVEL